ncbi:MAG: hypothetical protein HY287_00020 [Planctomycetes bacterium]|nr:hypothetical protein [Planctomycetota bacterium]
MSKAKFSFVDLIGCIVVLMIIVMLAGPAFAQIRSLSRRDQCALNVRGIGNSMKIYANDNQEKWAIPAFKRGLIDNGGIDYLNNRSATDGEPTDSGEVGFDRANETTSETPGNPSGGSTAVSVTRSFWMMVRSGDIAERQFICPSSRDAVDPGDFLFDGGDYYDFAGYENISYGYQVPFGPRDTQPREGADGRQVVAADKGPYYLDRLDPMFETRRGKPLYYDDSPLRWRPYNSPNHGRQGQNVLRGDGSGLFFDTPLAGVNGDNIYTLMTDDGWDENGSNRIHGESPHYSSFPNPYPGQNAFGPGPNRYSSTDSLIYP